MEQSKNPSSPEPAAPPSAKNASAKPRASYNARTGKNVPDAWRPGDTPPPRQHAKARAKPAGAPSPAAMRHQPTPGVPGEVDCPGPDGLDPRPDLPRFEPVAMKPRHDGWTPERQRAFIAALADTGNVTRACRYVNMSTTNAYGLRRHVHAESFRRAWDAALDLGVQRLKDELYERALDGQLRPVFVGGKLKGFQRVKSDRLLMFALRMNAMDERGRRLSASYFDPAAARLHAGTGCSDGGERARPALYSPSREGRGVGPAGRLGASITVPALTRAEKDDTNAAMVAHFDPVAMTLPEIEAMQATLAEAAARRRAEEQGPPEHDPALAFIDNPDGTFKAVGPLEELYPLADGEEAEVEFDAEEDRWWELE